MSKSINNQNDLSDIFGRADKLSSDTKGLWGKMNVNQMLRHVSMAANFAFAESLAIKKPGFFTRHVMKWMVMNLPAPKNAKTLDGLDTVALGINPPNFEEERKELKDVFANISKSKGPFKTNPFLGDLSKDEWGRLCYVHANHHFKQFGV
jgi:hypothetical protein